MPNPYENHPTMSKPPKRLVKLIDDPQGKCVAGTKYQVKTSLKKKHSMEYKDSGIGFFFRIRGTLFQNSWRIVLCSLIVATILTCIHEFAESIKFSDKPHTFTIIPVGFLLVFRSNLSYARWWEGRCMIGMLVFACRNVGIKSGSLLRGPTQLIAQHSETVFRLALAMMVSIRHSVQKASSEEESLNDEGKKAFKQLKTWELSHFLTEEELAALAASPTVPPPMMINKMLYQAVTAPTIGDVSIRYKWPTAVDDVNRHVQEILQTWQAMMKIVQTPMPFPYAHSLEIFLAIWVFSVPLPLLDPSVDLGWATIPITGVIAVLLFGINNVGSEIEDPFGNDRNDFDLVAFQIGVQNELAGFCGKAVWAPIENKNLKD
eukprot:TRINITY_DN13478_c0_g1_i1.p1 TRINITY_DN13478_c0_g1~~TRINITY_DN13478_c0_g1_i1.p1  ORF type:complete len:375 (+),score=80.40 TRINITY_DN13478_c0_g1_i1:46-1170(+)